MALRRHHKCTTLKVLPPSSVHIVIRVSISYRSNSIRNSHVKAQLAAKH